MNIMQRWKRTHVFYYPVKINNTGLLARPYDIVKPSIWGGEGVVIILIVISLR